MMNRITYYTIWAALTILVAVILTALIAGAVALVEVFI